MKQIPGFSNYCATEDGQIWSSQSNKFLTLTKNSRGYLCVELFKDKIGYYKLVHRLILETFAGPCPDGMQCRHLDGSQTNNILSNLRWGTARENGNDRIKHGTSCAGEDNPIAKLTEPDVRMVIYMYRTGEFTMQEIADVYDITKQRVWQIVHKKAWKHIWEVNI